MLSIAGFTATTIGTFDGTGTTVNRKYGNLRGSHFFAFSANPERELIRNGVPTRNGVYQYIRQNLDLLNVTEGYSVGLWFHEGKTYYDVVRTEQNKEKALAEAKEAKQLAIFDLNEGEEIYV